MTRHKQDVKKVLLSLSSEGEHVIEEWFGEMCPNTSDKVGNVILELCLELNSKRWALICARAR